MTIDRNSPMPMYYQLKRLLLAKIESGELQHDDILPTEQQLQEMYTLSRTTVRQALYELECEGVVYRQRGRGTFVNNFKIGLSTFTAPTVKTPVEAPKTVNDWKLLSADWVTPTDDVASTLQVDARQNVFRLERLRLENGAPIGHYCAFVAAEYAPIIDEQNFVSGESLRYLRVSNLLEDCLTDLTFKAITADETFAGLFDAPINEPLLRIRRIIRTPTGKVVELLNAVYRGSRFEYDINNSDNTVNLNRTHIKL
ncbi:MAG: GntR family transcriptional regulator [Aggregatilineales bacterium]